MREDIHLRTADYRLRLFVEYARSLDRLYWDAYELSKKLDGYGVSSPRWLPPEEAKVQRGTRIYSDENLLQLMDDETEAWARYHDRSAFCNRCGEIFQTLDSDELELLYLRYERGYTLEQISNIICYSKTSVFRILDNVLEKF